MTPNIRPITISKDQLEQIKHDLRGAEAELGLWKQHLDAMLNRGSEERKFIVLVWERLNYAAGKHHEIPKAYLEAHKSDSEAKANLVRITIAKMEAQITTMRRLIEESEKSVVVPSQFS